MNSKLTSPHVFLSYSRDDVSIMIRIREELESKGIRAWTDEGLIPGTESWKRDIEKAIRDALGIVVILSPSAKQSLWVERELDFARVHGIRVFPILVHGEPNNAIPIELINAQWIDIRGEVDFSSQIRNLILAIEGKRSESRSSVEYQEPSSLSTKPTVSKATTKVAITYLLIVGVCIILATVAIIFGPEIIENVGDNNPKLSNITVSNATSMSPIETPNQSESPTSPPPVEGTLEIPTNTEPPTILPTYTRTPQWGFQDNCIYPSLWTTYPIDISTTDNEGCLIASNLGFETHDQGLSISVQNPISDERYGIYSPIHGDVLIEFNVRIDQLETGADDELVSLGFGVISLDPVNTETDGFVFYVIESPKTGYPIFLKKGERGGFEQYIEIDSDYFRYELGTNHRLSFFLKGNQLTIYIDGKFIRETTLAYEERAFFIGHKFENMGSLSAKLSNLSIQER